MTLIIALRKIKDDFENTSFCLCFVIFVFLFFSMKNFPGTLFLVESEENCRRGKNKLHFCQNDEQFSQFNYLIAHSLTSKGQPNLYYAFTPYTDNLKHGQA